MKTETEQGVQTVCFHLASAGEQQAFVVIREPSSGATWTLPMRLCDDGQWELVVALRAGSYHARYYAGDDHRIIYHGPAFAAHSSNAIRGGVHGMDSVVHVLPMDETSPSLECDGKSSGIPRQLARPADQAEQLRLMMACAMLASNPAIGVFGMR